MLEDPTYFPSCGMCNLKKDAFDLEFGDELDMPTHICFACNYAKDVNICYKCSMCPITWVEGIKILGACQMDGSPYCELKSAIIWLRYEFKECAVIAIIRSQAGTLATQIRDMPCTDYSQNLHSL